MIDPIKVKKEGPILEVTIDRPKANAIDSKTSIILGDVFADFRDNPDLRVAILTGAGEKFFSAGWDLKAVYEGEQADADYGIGIYKGEDLYETKGFIVHFFSKEKINLLSNGFEIVNIEKFEEGTFPRKLSRVTLKKNSNI